MPEFDVAGLFCCTLKSILSIAFRGKSIVLIYRASDILCSLGAVNFMKICEMLRNSQKHTKYCEVC